MKIAVLGTGGVGGYYGALLARKGHAVTFIARGAHLQAIQSNGLQIKSVLADFRVKPAAATEEPAGAGLRAALPRRTSARRRSPIIRTALSSCSSATVVKQSLKAL